VSVRAAYDARDLGGRPSISPDLTPQQLARRASSIHTARSGYRQADHQTRMERANASASDHEQ
jgi:hypothetical protein